MIDVDSDFPLIPFPSYLLFIFQKNKVHELQFTRKQKWSSNILKKNNDNMLWHTQIVGKLSAKSKQ